MGLNLGIIEVRNEDLIMDPFMTLNLKGNTMLDQIKFPKYYDKAAIINAFKTLGTVELYEFFECKNGTAFSNLLRKYFPDKPLKMSYSEYVRELLDTDPKLQQAKTSEPTVEKKPLILMKKEAEWDEPVKELQPRIRTEDDIWRSQTLFKQAGSSHQKQWLQAGHPDPLKETVDNPYPEEHVFTENLSL